jgi:hypothetical protein
VAPPPVERGWSLPAGRDLIAFGLIALALFIAISAVRQVRAGHLRQRVDLVGDIASMVALLAIAWRRGPWMETSWLLWSGAATVAGIAVAAQCWYARRLPWVAPGRRWRSLASAFANAVIAVLLVGWIL